MVTSSAAALPCLLQDLKNRVLGRENGELQRKVLTLAEHETQLEEVRTNKAVRWVPSTVPRDLMPT